MLLSESAIGRTVRVALIDESPLKPKLIEMGIVSDRILKVLFRAPFGDPIAVQVGDSVLSLRRDEAGLIRVTEPDLATAS